MQPMRLQNFESFCGTMPTVFRPFTPIKPAMHRLHSQFDVPRLKTKNIFEISNFRAYAYIRGESFSE